MKLKIVKKIAIIIVINIILLGMMVNISNAASNNILVEDITSEEEVKETIKNLILTINSEGMTQDLLVNTINLYTDLSKEYTNVEIADFIEENKSELINNGVSNEDINSIEKVLKLVSTEQAKKVLETINVDEVTQKIENGEELSDILKEVVNNMSGSEKVDLALSLLLSANIIRKIITVAVILFVYRTLLRCVIYKKSGRKAWAAFVPIYRNITMLKVCNMNPWWLLLLFIPVIGWAIIWLVSVASKFMLAENFGKGTIFAFGLWLLAPIFETILAFSWNTKYIDFEEE